MTPERDNAITLVNLALATVREEVRYLDDTDDPEHRDNLQSAADQLATALRELHALRGD